MVKNTKICFTALGAYPLLKGSKVKRIVGPDVHQVILAKELVSHGFEVSIIVYGQGFCSAEYLDGIEIIKICNSLCDFKIFGIFIKFISLIIALFKSRAAIYYQAGGVPGIIPIFCKISRKKYVCEIASDAQVNRNIIIKKSKEYKKSFFSLDSFGTWLDIKLSDEIIVQSIYQKEILKRNFRRDGIIIKMPFLIPDGEIPEKEEPPIVLWVGSMAEVKQPHLFLELAKRIPELRFQMIGGPSGDQNLYEYIKENAKKIPNLEFLGVIQFYEIDKYFSRASFLVNTSMFEGFPNAFVQAWMYGTPVISLNVDPDELICKKKLGIHCKGFNSLVENLRQLHWNKELSTEMGRNGIKYVEEMHNLKKNIKEYIKVFESLMD